MGNCMIIVTQNTNRKFCLSSERKESRKATEEIISSVIWVRGILNSC